MSLGELSPVLSLQNMVALCFVGGLSLRAAAAARLHGLGLQWRLRLFTLGMEPACSEPASSHGIMGQCLLYTTLFNEHRPTGKGSACCSRGSVLFYYFYYTQCVSCCRSSGCNAVLTHFFSRPVYPGRTRKQCRTSLLASKVMG